MLAVFVLPVALSVASCIRAISSCCTVNEPLLSMSVPPSTSSCCSGVTSARANVELSDLSHCVDAFRDWMLSLELGGGLVLIPSALSSTWMLWWWCRDRNMTSLVCDELLTLAGLTTGFTVAWVAWKPYIHVWVVTMGEVCLAQPFCQLWSDPRSVATGASCWNWMIQVRTIDVTSHAPVCWRSDRCCFRWTCSR